VNIELAIARLAANLAKDPRYKPLARVLVQLAAQVGGIPFTVGGVEVKHRAGALVAVAAGEVLASSTVPRGGARVQRGSGEQGLKKRTVTVSDADWGVVVELGGGNASAGFRRLLRERREP
jgi:hypothetical protein